MGRTLKRRNADRRPTLWWAVGAATLILSLVAIGIGVRSPVRSLAAPAPRPSYTTVPVAPPSQFLTRSIPVRLFIPNISLSAPLTTVGLNSNGTVQVPPTVETPGWYRLGPSPGQDGSAVILGHVDSYSGPGIFIGLRRLVPGDRLTVLLANGNVAHFDVTSVQQFLKTSFPDAAVYRSRGFSALQLVTCGGRFNAAKGSYESNIVVFSTRVP